MAEDARSDVSYSGMCGTKYYDMKFCARSQDEANSLADNIVVGNTNSAPQSSDECRSRMAVICGSQVRVRLRRIGRERGIGGGGGLLGLEDWKRREKTRIGREQ
eukprot:759719-Hanusia_phi.AAC.2